MSMLMRINCLLPLYQETCSCVADLPSLNDYYVLDWLKAQTASGLTMLDAVFCRPRTLLWSWSMCRAEAAVMITNSG